MAILSQPVLAITKDLASLLSRVDINSPDNLPIPDGWIRCDGSIIPAPSPWANLPTPNLNGEKRFLRGGSPAEILIVQDDMFQVHRLKTSLNLIQ